MKNSILTQEEIVSKVTKILEKIIIENTQSILKGDYLTRPNYGYSKFYINWTDGSYDMSLYSLINFILYEEKIYQNILSEKQYANCLHVIENIPEAIYYPDSDSDEDLELQDMLDAIYFRCIVFVGKKLNSMGLDVRDCFEDYLNDSDYQKS
jgi:hypothetical protein